MAALPLIVFDVNETLLDLQTMEPIFERIFGEKGAMRLWFANLVMYSLALSVAGSYVPFTDIGSAAMKMLADTQGIKIDSADKEETLSGSRPRNPEPLLLERIDSQTLGRLVEQLPAEYHEVLHTRKPRKAPECRSAR